MKEKVKFKGYELNEMPPVKHLLPLSIQHVLLFIAGSLAVPLIIADGAGMNPEQTTIMIQCMIFVAGIGTMLQAFGFGPVGNKLPTVLGPIIRSNALFKAYNITTMGVVIKAFNPNGYFTFAVRLAYNRTAFYPIHH